MSRAWLLVALGLVTAAPVAHAGPGPVGPRRARPLFSGFLGRMNVNQWDCGLDAVGHVCVDPNGSTTVGGGFWPKGTPDQYVFGSGAQVAGVVDPSSGFEWSGDTTAAFFEDPSGTHENGDKLSLIWQSSNPSDVANWPLIAYVPNDPLYNNVLVGRKAASQEDVWAWYWDGNPNLNAGRPHPLGVLVDERGMAWNFPSGNEAIQYWVYTITNITASNPSVYASHPSPVSDSLAALGARFQAANNAAFGVHIPSGGYAIDNAFVAFSMDADVSANARQNFTTAFLPFNMGIAFKSNWYAPEFIYPAALFSAPFAPTVGEVGVKYLKSPVDPVTHQEVGLTLYSGTVNGGNFGDAANATQVYRYLSGTLDPSKGDAPCNYPRASNQQPKDVHVCYIPVTPDDIRFFESSGPLTLAPGQSQSIVVAYIAAAPVDNPAIAARSASLIFPPGGPFPAQSESLAIKHDTLRTVDRIFGALSDSDANADGKIEQNEVKVVPRSLLGKGLVAQAVFDAHFLLPFPPEGPDFFLIPGDNQVTVVWKATNTEQVGDPYFAVASDPTTALYDPNYREFDVEGYRIYRGRTSGDLQMIAQFDKTGTSFIDYTGEIYAANCAPELGVFTGCAKAFQTAYPYTVADTVPLAGTVVQVPPGGRVKLASGDILALQTDTAVVGASTATLCGLAKNCQPLTDTGVPFSYVDKGVKNGFTYFYTVAAFDVNSVKSTGVGFSSIEGKGPVKAIVPRKNSAQVAQGTVTLVLAGANGAVVDTAPLPTLDNATGIFSGPQPATNGISVGFAAYVPAIVLKDSLQVRVDSVLVGNPDPEGFGIDVPATYYLTATGSFAPTSYVLPLDINATSGNATASAVLPSIKSQQTPAKVYGGDSTYSLYPQLAMKSSGTWQLVSYGRGSINDSPTNANFNGPRWWAGSANENTSDPNGLMCAPASGGCLQADLSRNAGAITGVGIFHPQAYSTVNSQPMRDLEALGATVFRAADFKVYWGATPGNVDSVVDVTHKVKVAFRSTIGPTWGFLNDSSFVGTTASATPDTSNNRLTWSDIFCVAPSPAMVLVPRGLGDCGAPAPLMNHARLSPVSFNAAAFANTPGLSAAPATGNGFILYLNGNFFLMQMATLPSSTVWNARFYAGNIQGSAGSYAFLPDLRPPAVPGLIARARYTGTAFDATKTSDSALSKIHTVPDPYYVTSAFEQSPNSKILRFVNLPSQCIIRIYSLSGILVQELAVSDPTGGGEAQWNLRNRNQQYVASGVYFYHVETPDGKAKIGRFTVVNFAR